MTAVVLSRKLAIDLAVYGGSSFPGRFAEEFQLWKDGGIGPGDTFGKNTPFIKPAEVVRCELYKVHLEVSSVTSHWNYLLDVKKIEDPQAFTSDRLLVYSRLADFAYRPYLLLTVLEPGHEFMEDPEKVKILAEAYEQERKAFSTRTPACPWVVVGMP